MTNKSIDTGILTTTISDHFAVFSQIATKVKKNLPNFFFSRNMSDTNKSNFKDSLNNCGWGDVLSEKSPQVGFDLFFNKFNSLHELHFPLNEVKFNKNIHKIEPFMTRGLLISRKHKMLLSNISLRDPSVDNKTSFKKFRSLYNKLIREAKKKF